MANVPVIWFIVTSRCDRTSGSTADWFVAVSRQRVSHWHQTESEGTRRPTIRHVRYTEQYSNMALWLSGQTSMFGVVLFVSKSLGNWETKEFAILARNPRSHARILIYQTPYFYKELISIRNPTVWRFAWSILRKYSGDRNSQFPLALACFHHMHPVVCFLKAPGNALGP